MYKQLYLLIALMIFLISCIFTTAAYASESEFRPPAVPLVTSDPYLSIWSESDDLNDDVTRHWTHHPQSLVSLIREDGKTFRLMGDDPKDIPPMPQLGLVVFPTRTIYTFGDAHLLVTMTFMTPSLPNDLDILTRPVTYISWSVRSRDGQSHTVSLYDSASSELAVNTPDEKVVWSKNPDGPLTVMRFGTDTQPILATMGDDTRIDWGYAYLASSTSLSNANIGYDSDLILSFLSKGKLPSKQDNSMPRAVDDNQPVMAFTFQLGKVDATPVDRYVMIAYDERYSIKFFGEKLRPYWRRHGMTSPQLLQSAAQEYPELEKRCRIFDHELMTDLTQVGGKRYANIAALAYRQCLAGTGIAADSNGKPLLFTKENTSNGDIATVDVIFPMDPMLILFSPTLAKASLVPDLLYADSSHWQFPNAPHDLGTYPIAFGRDDGGEGMPVEESGNMLILCDAIAQEDGNADFVSPWWSKLTQWAWYLKLYGNDPEDQLCTDDFMGHLAHNANLSIKAILGIAAFGDLCRIRGELNRAARYKALARKYALHWMQAANDGNHYRLAFDKPNTWSQKYNLVWDKILGLNIFPPSVAEKEIAFYKTVMQPYGLPLDSRTHLTKTDWSVWTATLAESKADFETFVSPIYDYLNQTTVRDPLADSYVTDDIHSSGMHARPVVGGLFIKMLANPAIWKKWSGKDKRTTSGWAPLPVPPALKEVMPTGLHASPIWRFTTQTPVAGWQNPGFNDSSWKEGAAGFGTTGTPSIAIHTNWSSDDIWLRREVTMPAVSLKNLRLYLFHDEDVQIYINGIPAAQESGFITSYETLPINPAALAQLEPGAQITLAVHCHQTTGGQGIDVGMVEIIGGK